MSDKLDCGTCGACCIADYDGDETYVHLDEIDIKRFTVRERRLLVTDHGMRTKYDRTGNCRCKALRGTVGVRASCSVYARRPRVCRNFPVGGNCCLQARALIFDEAR